MVPPHGTLLPVPEIGERPESVVGENVPPPYNHVLLLIAGHFSIQFFLRRETPSFKPPVSGNLASTIYQLENPPSKSLPKDSVRIEEFIPGVEQPALLQQVRGQVDVVKTRDPAVLRPAVEIDDGILQGLEQGFPVIVERDWRTSAPLLHGSEQILYADPTLLQVELRPWQEDFAWDETPRQRKPAGPEPSPDPKGPYAGSDTPCPGEGLKTGQSLAAGTPPLRKGPGYRLALVQGVDRRNCLDDLPVGMLQKHQQIITRLWKTLDHP